nr:nitrilase [Desulfobacteraceae bacterium]
LLQCLRQTSEDHAITILSGMAEKDPSGRIFVTHLVFIPGKPLLKYRKLHIAPPEKAVFSEGESAPVFETQGFKFGIQLCYDAHFPTLSTHMAQQGADAIFIPHASPRGTPEEKFASWMRHIPARSYDNGMFVIVCNQAGENGNGLSFPGISFVTDPSGHLLTKDTSGNEGILYADLKKHTMNRVRNHSMRYFLPNTRNDLF